MQLWCNYIYFSVDESFVFLIYINRQQCSCPALVVSLGVLLAWPSLACGVAVAELSSSSSGWWRPGGRDCSFPCTLFKCLLHRVPAKNNAKSVVPSKTQPPLYRPLHSLFSTDLMHRSHYPGLCSCWSDLCCTRYFSFKYSFIKHEVRPLLTFRDEPSLVFAL